MTTLVIEPFGGLAGDMFLAALLDLEDPRFGLTELVVLAEELVPGEASLHVDETRRGGFRAKQVTVRTPESERAPHRHLADLVELVERAPLSPDGRARARRVFRCIAEAEARVHGAAVETIHFHEVGAVDSLIDVCGAVLALERLGIERVASTPPLVGGGTVSCAHGELPVPAPGTAEILRGLPFLTGGSTERLTPTGAALYAELVDDYEWPDEFRAQGIGYGAGRRDPESGPANLVRVHLGHAGGRGGRTEVWLGEFNLDDAPGEEVGFAVEELRAAGALEVWTSACQMKKDRPGVVVAFLARAAQRTRLEDVAFRNTPTLGVRWSRHERRECGRSERAVELDGHRVRVKERSLGDGVPPRRVDLSPEHDDLAALARATGRSLAELRERVIDLAWAALETRT